MLKAFFRNNTSWFSVTAARLLIVIFSICYLLLAWYNIPAADDYYLLYQVRERGMINSVAWFYHTWNTRWAAILVSNVVFYFYETLNSFFVFHIFTLLLVFAALYKLMRLLCALTGLPAQSLLNKATLSGFVLLSFFAAGNPSEIFFWVTVSPMYLWSLAAMIFLVGTLLKLPGEKTNLPEILLGCIAAIYIGAASEVYALVTITGMILLWIFDSIKGKDRDQLRLDKILFISCLLLLLASIAVTVSGRGLQSRFALLPEASIMQAFQMSLATIKQLVSQDVALKLAALIALFIFSMTNLRLSDNHHAAYSIKKLTTISFILIVLCAISIFITCYITSDVASQRTLAFTYFSIMALTSIWGSYIGIVYPTISQGNKRLITGLFSLCLLWMILQFVVQTKSSMAYNIVARERIIKLENTAQQKEVIYLDPLPGSYWLKSAEISADTNNYLNQHLKLYFQLNAAPALKDQQ